MTVYLAHDGAGANGMLFRATIYKSTTAYHPRLTKRFCGSDAGLPITLAAALWSCGTVNALSIALARHDAPLDGNGVFPLVLA